MTRYPIASASSRDMQWKRRPRDKGIDRFEQVCAPVTHDEHRFLALAGIQVVMVDQCDIRPVRSFVTARRLLRDSFYAADSVSATDSSYRFSALASDPTREPDDLFETIEGCQADLAVLLHIRDKCGALRFILRGRVIWLPSAS